ncbi:FecCD family ABC transporter permease [Umboniibacter marinipuniceus]|uniref:Iron complex transport system permease protein n=1 Tax=Umboniibacter marinipuniceus TaxID=569599 RepID=A0A3M0AIE7_9GAMM|nr:iron ABC transporter permease [Umboniibacter marinipuniceus]RMA82375.1 iron complex transport system permease protein [Umboniibacter marinipuniceus]
MALNLRLGLILAVLLLTSLSLGSVWVSPLTGLLDLLSQETSLASMVIGDIRLPRTLLAALCGASLGLAGAALQGLLRNPLADPGLVGASQGAALGAAAAFYFAVGGLAASYVIPAAALLGAALCLSGVLALAGSSRPALLILAGLAIATVASALLAMVLNFAPNPYAMQELVFWLLGSVANRDYNHVTIALLGLVIAAVLILPQKRFLFALTLGEEVAETSGFNAKRQGRLIIIGSAIAVGSCVAVAGNIGFVGLIVPHLIRPLVGHRPDRSLVPAMIGGAALVVAADLFVRAVPSGQELKLGVVTSLLGAPLFIKLIISERKKWL